MIRRSIPGLMRRWPPTANICSSKRITRHTRTGGGPFASPDFFPQGKVDSEVYEFATAREYINAVYLRGVQMLHNLRVDIGDEAFFQLLRAYLAAGDGQIAEPTLFWRQLPPEQRDLTLATRTEYLRQHDDKACLARSGE